MMLPNVPIPLIAGVMILIWYAPPSSVFNEWINGYGDRVWMRDEGKKEKHTNEREEMAFIPNSQQEN